MIRKYRFFRSVGREGYDLIVNTNRGNVMMEAAIMAWATGIPSRLGFHRDGAGFLNTIRAEFQYDRYLLDQNLDLLARIGIPRSGKEEVRLRIPDPARKAARERLISEGLQPGDPAVAIHPGAKFDARYKMWPMENYIRLIREIIPRYRVKVLLIGDPSETEAASACAAAVQNDHLINLAGRTTLAEMAAVIEQSRLFIGNDSGPLHVAVALKKPSIGLFLSTSPDQLLPPANNRLFILKSQETPLYLHQPLFRYEKKDTHSNDLTVPAIPYEEVSKAIHRILPGLLNPA
jgi:ADP-heptose:LPS heptosyltransferase